MSTTPNLLIDHIATNQASKEVSCNAAFDAFDGAIAGLLTVTMDPTSSYTVAAPDGLHHGIFRFIGPINLPLDIVLPQNSKQYYLCNATSEGGSPVMGHNLTAISAAPTTNATITNAAADGLETFTYTYTGLSGTGFIVGKWVTVTECTSGFFNVYAQVLTWTPSSGTAGTFTVFGTHSVFSESESALAVQVYATVTLPPADSAYIPVYCDGYDVFQIGSSILLETNGVNNSHQNVINITGGANVTAVESGGTVTISATGTENSNVLVGGFPVSDGSDFTGYTVFCHIRGRKLLQACNTWYPNLTMGFGQVQGTLYLSRSVVYKMNEVDPNGQLFGPYTLTSSAGSPGPPFPASNTYTGTGLKYLHPLDHVLISGFSHSANNGLWTVLDVTSTTVTVNNGNGVAETAPGSPPTATIQLSIIADSGGPPPQAISLPGSGASTNIAGPFTMPLAPGHDYLLAMYFAASDNTANNPPSGIAYIPGIMDTFANDGNTMKGALVSGDVTNLSFLDVIPTLTSYGVGILVSGITVVS